MDSMTYTEKFSPSSVVIDSVYWCAPERTRPVCLPHLGSMIVKFKTGGKWEYRVPYVVFEAFGNAVSPGSYYARQVKDYYDGVNVDHVELLEAAKGTVAEIASRFEIVYLDSDGQEVFFPVEATDESDALRKAANVLAGFVGLNLRISRVTHYFG